MSFNETLRAAIAATIKTPANPKITGAALQSKLLSILDALDSGGIWMGEATPSTSPSTESNCFFLATTQGTYTNFLDGSNNPITIVSGEAAILSSFTTQENASIRWNKSPIVTPSTPNGFVSYAVAQALTPTERSQALENIGGAVAEGENPGLIAGDIIPKTTSPVETNNTFAIHTTGGDMDIQSGASQLKTIRGNINTKLEPFLADVFVSTGMNLVDPEQTLTIGGRTAYYFPVAKGTWGSYGTTQENNGYVVVGESPYAVYFSTLKPTTLDYGDAITPVQHEGKDYYTTPYNGWMTVVMNSGSEAPAVHIAWSNYKDDIAGLFNNTVKRISPFVQWIHVWGMAALFGTEYAVFDEINIAEQRCYRRTDRAALNALSWTMTTEASTQETPGEEYTYVFTATVSAMKSGGLYRHSLPGLTISGKTLTYRSTEITTVPDFVVFLGSSLFYYELATQASETFANIGVSLSMDNLSNDFGLTYFLYDDEIATVPAYVTEAFGQGGKDQLFNAVTYLKIMAEVVASALSQLDCRMNSIEKRENVECVNLTVKRRASITGWREVDSAPAAASSPGNPGDYFIATDYIYICVAVNTWKRSALSTF